MTISGLKARRYFWFPVLVLVGAVANAESPRSAFGFSYQFGAMVGNETMQSGSLLARKQLNWTGHGMLGIHVYWFTLGGMAEYRSHHQITASEEVGYTDASGISILYGPQARILFADRVLLSGTYFLGGEYAPRAASAFGETVKYAKPKGVRAMISYRLKKDKKLYLDIAYSRVGYATTLVGPATLDIAGDPIYATTMDFGFSLAF